MRTELSDKFFGGTNEVRKKLVDALKQARERQGITPEELDARYRLGLVDTVKCRDYEANPERMTPFTFSLAAFSIGATLDRALPLKLSPDDTRYVVEHMKKAGAYLVGAGNEVTREVAAPVYLLLKIMEELEQEAKVGRAA